MSGSDRILVAAARPGAVAADRAPAALLALPLVCMLVTLAGGLVAAVKAVVPRLGVLTAPLEVVQPLHTLMAVAMVMSGAACLVLLALRRLGAAAPAVEVLAAAGLGAFVLGSAGAVAARQGSGAEYLVWPVALTALPAGVFGVLAACVLGRVRVLTGASAEGAWLVVLGVLLVPLGLVERMAGLVGALPHARGLALEWHALDIVFAGLNAILYGVGLLMLAGQGRGAKPRPLWLYALAAFCFLSTFGHHHYMSPQPAVIKAIAVTASMLAGVSFVRHARAVLRNRTRRERGSAAAPFLHAVEVWTLFAVGTGVLIAVPQVNAVVHGTHAIVGHAMGAMIGVDVMMILGGLLYYAGSARGDRVARWLVALASVALALVTLDLVAAGVVKGVARVERPYAEYLPAVRSALAPLPVLGALLAVSLTLLGAHVAWAVRDAWCGGRGRA